MSRHEVLEISIHPDAQRFIAERGVEPVFRRLLDNIPLRYARVHAIHVSLQEQYDGSEPRVVFDVTRDHPGGTYDPSDSQWIDWVVDSCPPEELQHFCVLTNYGD